MCLNITSYNVNSEAIFNQNALVMKVKYLPIIHKQSDAGSLLVIEDNNNIPFAIKRIYYILNVPPGEKRGAHAHKKFNQLAFCLQGSCKMLLDDGEEQLELTLDNRTQGLLLEPMIWHEIYNFSKDCILSVIADANYDEQDYIRDHNEFLQRNRTRITNTTVEQKIISTQRAQE